MDEYGRCMCNFLFIILKCFLFLFQCFSIHFHIKYIHIYMIFTGFLDCLIRFAHNHLRGVHRGAPSSVRDCQSPVYEAEKAGITVTGAAGERVGTV